MSLISVSCRYAEGPYLSFINPEERLVGYWKLDAVYLNDTKIDSSAVLPHNPGCYYAFFTERMVSVSALQGTTYYESMYGEWALQNHERSCTSTMCSATNAIPTRRSSKNCQGSCLFTNFMMIRATSGVWNFSPAPIYTNLIVYETDCFVAFVVAGAGRHLVCTENLRRASPPP